VLGISARAGRRTPTTESGARPEIALDFTYLRSNAPPASCTCFNLFGGSATFAWPLKLDKGQFALVGDITAAHAGSISAAAATASRSARYTAGVRYLPHVHQSPLQPFGQVLAGHGSFQRLAGQAGAPPGAANASAAFATNLGGGVDLNSQAATLTCVCIEADYLLTTVDNGKNNIQNNLRISGGRGDSLREQITADSKPGRRRKNCDEARRQFRMFWVMG
jgi:outer membrane immunogenic protein